MRDRGAPDAEQFRQRLLCQGQDVTTIRPVVDVQQPAGEARFDGMQRIAGRDVLDLRQHRPGEKLYRTCDGGTAFERDVKSRGRDLQRRPGNADDCGHG